MEENKRECQRMSEGFVKASLLNSLMENFNYTESLISKLKEQKDGEGKFRDLERLAGIKCRLASQISNTTRELKG